MPNFFIGRPNFAWVVAIFITLAGVLAILSLPVSQFPVVAPPQISILATYPGASASTLVDSVTSVLEEELNGATHLMYYESSSSSNGTAEITATFQPGTAPNLAQVDVQNRLKKAESRLPAAVTQQGLQVDQANAGFLLIYALTYKGDDTHKDVVGLSDYAARSINNELRRLPGVGKLQFFSSEAAMRIWIDPQKLLGYGLSVDDVNRAIAAQNVQVPAGSFGSRPGSAEQELTATIAVKGMLETPREFERIVLRANVDGSTVRLSDVARLEIGRQDYGFDTLLDGKKAVSGAIQLAPGANAIATAKAVRERLQQLSAAFPADVEYSIPYDTSLFVDVAIEKVIHTLIEAVVLVFLVMFLFLQNLRYTLIPTIVVPVCLLGTFAVMSLLGFSINMMTMFGMVLAIGILVDDAIVVVENVERIMAEEGLSPRDATIKAMQQVSGAIVGITLVLAAVFLPLAFMSGSVGVIYQQFSLSLAVSIMFSGFLALTLTPALCATLLKPIAKGHHAEKKGFFGWFNRLFGRLTDRFEALNHRLVRRAGRYMVVYVAIVAVLGVLYVRLPESFVPVEDQGTLIIDMQLPPGATHGRTQALVDDVEKYLLAREGVDSAFSVLGFSFSGTGQNAAIAFPTLKDWSQRGPGQSAMDEVAALNERFASVPDGAVMAVSPPPIEGLGNSGGFSLRLQDRGGLGREALNAARDQLLQQANTSPVIAYAMMEGLQDAPQLRLDVDRDKAQALGVGFDAVRSAISTAYGSATVNDFANAGRLQRVVVQADVKDRMTPEKVLELSVANRDGRLVPLKSFVTTAWESGAVQISRYNGYPAIKISGDAAPGSSTGQAMAELERMIGELPAGIGYEWTGLSYQEKLAGAQAPFLFTLAILVVFLLLVALYESWAIPVSVMLIVPIGALGSVLAVSILGMSNDVYFKVGLITVIGLAAKNAILIIEFAKDLMAQGHSVVDAALRAAKLRFRPIVMTSLAFILGVVPLVIASGAGAASQRSIGTGVIGGMLSATLLGVVFVPIFFVWVLSLAARRKPRAGATPPPPNSPQPRSDIVKQYFKTPPATLSALAAALLIAGCSMAPVHERPAAPIPTSWAQPGGAKALAASAPLDWETFVTDESLRQTIALALAHNRDLRQTLLNIDAARAQYRVQRADRLPGLGLQADGTRQRTPADISAAGVAGTQGTYQVGLGVTAFELDLFGRVRSLSEAALQQYLAVEQNAQAARISLVGEVIQAQVTRDGAQRRLAWTQRTLDSRQASLQLVAQRHQAGAASALDYQEALGLQAQAQAELERMERETRQADNALRLLVGSADAALPAPRAQSTVLVQDIAVAAPSALLERRPDILAAEHELRARNADIGAARAAFFPRISLTGMFGSSSAELSGLFDAGSRSWSFTPQLVLPLFDGGRNRANLDLAQVRKNIAVAKYEGTIQTAFREVADALAATDTLRREEVSRLALARSSDAALRLSEARYRGGVDSHLRYLEAQRSAFSHELSAIEVGTQRQLALVQLFKALGGGWSGQPLSDAS